MKRFCDICGEPLNGGRDNHPECEEQAFKDALAIQFSLIDDMQLEAFKNEYFEDWLTRDN